MLRGFYIYLWLKVKERKKKDQNAMHYVFYKIAY